MSAEEGEIRDAITSYSENLFESATERNENKVECEVIIHTFVVVPLYFRSN